MNYKKRSANSLAKRFDHFVKLSEKKHEKGAYDYTLTKKDYINTRSYVRITCNSCGKTFKTLPQAHNSKKHDLHGACPDCHEPSIRVGDLSKIRWGANKEERITEFRDRMNKRHNGKYSYPHLNKEYESEYSTITVHCNECGNQYERVARCLKDENRYGGCPACNEQEMKRKIVEKNRERQLRNQKTRNLIQPFGYIYKISNKHSGKFYIGYTNMSLKKRFKAHFDETTRLSRGHRKCKSYLHYAMQKYGKESFHIEAIEAYEDVSALYLATREKEYIAKLKPHYNVSKGGEIGHLKKGALCYGPPRRII